MQIPLTARKLQGDMATSIFHPGHMQEMIVTHQPLTAERLQGNIEAQQCEIQIQND
jgi:hypothetical protein